MLTLESLKPDKPLSVFIAIAFAEKALPVWEGKYPEDMRPRRAIEAASEWLDDPFDANQSDIAAARAAVYDAANAANAAAVAAAHASAAASAYAARAAVYAARAAANAAANAAYVAADVASAATHAAKALETDKEALIHEVILENLDWILQYKIDNGQNFAQPELIFSIINEEQADKFLFNLEALR